MLLEPIKTVELKLFSTVAFEKLEDLCNVGVRLTLYLQKETSCVSRSLVSGWNDADGTFTSMFCGYAPVKSKL